MAEWVKNGLNQGRYQGECIEIDSVLREMECAAREHQWNVEILLDEAGQRLLALTRRAASARASVYLSAGIHGDEPGSPLAALRLLRENSWPEEIDLYFCPCLNPRAFELNCRGNPLGVDLNRDYRDPKTAEILAHTAWLARQPRFDLCLCLHEDWESHGFYLYELNPQGLPTLAESMIEEAGRVCPVDRSPVIEGRPAENGIIRPHVDIDGRPDWPEAFYLIRYKAPLSYTLEAPSDYPLSTRVNGLVTAVNSGLVAFLRT
jgi:hypothetical protein